ncbi:hypothetical protein [Sphingobacterium sp. 1.A.5]|uniref:hypothetical protein n=1 Tax=Sphingobacterium sp. 1.A.5 TaxID=2044604 RepID=UPI000C0BF992|nr:hypothetical protein [Sphingobacterium sp. 1.A.5]
MALNLSALTDYVRQNSTEFVVKSIMDASTVAFLKSEGSLMVGIKGTESIPLLDADVNLQVNDNCGRSPLGSTTITDAKITVVPLKDEQDYCPKAYEKKWTVEYLTQGQTYSELLFAQDFMKLRASKIAEANEKLIWQGDTASANANLNKFDGFNKLAPTAVTLPAGATLLERLQKALLTIDQAVKNAPDFVIFLSQEDYEAVNIELANKNIYKETSDAKLFGTSARLQPTSGLNGTDRFHFGRSRSYVIGTDLMGEEESAEMVYSTETKKIYMDFAYALGVQLVLASEVKVFKKSA